MKAKSAFFCILTICNATCNEQGQDLMRSAQILLKKSENAVIDEKDSKQKYK